MVKSSALRLVAAVTVAAGLFTTGLGNAASVAVAPDSPEAIATAKHGFDVSQLDPTCKACDDFYQYSNGGWLKDHPLDAQHGRYGKFIALADHNQITVHAILDDERNKPGAPGSPSQLVGDLYGACMDTDARDKAGIAPIADTLGAINGLTDTKALPVALARLHNSGYPAFFTFGGGADQKNSNVVIAQAGEGGLGLPERDYYFNAEPASARIRTAYAAHVMRTFVLAGDDAAMAQTEADASIKLEAALAQATRRISERRDPVKNYNLTPLATFESGLPHFDYAAYLKARSAPSFDSLNVSAPAYFPALDAVLATTPIADVKSYLRWAVLNRASNSLSTPFLDEAFSFSGKVLNGTAQPQDQWKRCATIVDGSVGQALGQEYVKRAFPPQARVRARQLVHNVEAALKDDLTTLAWMSPATRTEAIAKLADLGDKIGYPDTWRTYAGLTIDRASYAGDVARASTYEIARGLARIGKPVDKADFSMTPPTVNARYSPTLNDILFPAGILQPPFFNPDADDAINYGGIGAVIGHEMTHGFDDSGRKYDGKGNLRDWWTPADTAAYTSRATCVEKQFDSFVAVKGQNGEPDLHVKGALVLGESIADLGGMTIAYKAFKKTPEGASNTKIDGFTPDQRFFLGYGQIWGENINEQAARSRTTTDPHPLNQFRVDGPLSNTPEFATAFQCKLGDPMVRAATERCQIW